mgnify:CR=1 FL=1
MALKTIYSYGYIVMADTAEIVFAFKGYRLAVGTVHSVTSHATRKRSVRIPYAVAHSKIAVMAQQIHVVDAPIFVALGVWFASSLRNLWINRGGVRHANRKAEQN